MITIVVGPAAIPRFARAEGATAKIDDAATALDAELNQLRQERDTLTAVRSSTDVLPAHESDDVAAQREKLKKQLNGLLTELARRPKPEQKSNSVQSRRATGSNVPNGGGKRNQTKPVQPLGKKPKSTEVLHPEAAPAPVDPLALSQALFRTGDYNGALKAFELAKKTTTDPRDRMAIKYFSAACLNKLGNAQESMMLFREVANSKTDDVLADCARWQLSTQQWKETTRAKIARLRTMRTAEKPDAAEQDDDVTPRPDDKNEDGQP